MHKRRANVHQENEEPYPKDQKIVSVTDHDFERSSFLSVGEWLTIPFHKNLPSSSGASSTNSSGFSSSQKISDPQLPESDTSDTDSLPSCSAHRSSPTQSKQRCRTTFTSKQISQLEKVFEEKQYVEAADRLQLSMALGMTDTQVKTWFQNRRMKDKRKRTEEAHYYTKLAFANHLASDMVPIDAHGYQPALYPGMLPEMTKESHWYPGLSPRYTTHQQRGIPPLNQPGYDMSYQATSSQHDSYPGSRSVHSPYYHEIIGAECSCNCPSLYNYSTCQ